MKRLPMSFFITETTDEKPRVLLISSPHVLSQKIEGFFKQNDFDVTRKDLTAFVNLTDIKTREWETNTFYKIVLVLEEDFLQVRNWEHLFQFLTWRKSSSKTKTIL